MSQLLLRHESLKKASEAVLKETETCEGLAGDVLTQVVIETIRKYQQKLNVGIQDSVADLLDNFKAQIAETIVSHARGWRIANRDRFLFPKNCRFCFSKGESTVVVVEQDPQVRSLNMDSALLGSRTEQASESARRIALALPYAVFVFLFKQGRPYHKFQSLLCGWRTSPLSSLSDAICQPLLPNIHGNMYVCLGRVDHPVVPLAEQVGETLAYFWNSRFNFDLADNWWSKGTYSDKMVTGYDWEDNSADDPLFVLGVNYPRPKPLGEVVDSLVQSEVDVDETKFVQNLSEQLDHCVNGLFAKIGQYFRKTKFEKHHPASVTETVAKVLAEANSQLHDLVFAVNAEVQRLSQEIQSHNRHEPVAAGPYWEAG